MKTLLWIIGWFVGTVLAVIVGLLTLNLYVLPWLAEASQKAHLRDEAKRKKAREAAKAKEDEEVRARGAAAEARLRAKAAKANGGEAPQT